MTDAHMHIYFISNKISFMRYGLSKSIANSIAHDDATVLGDLPALADTLIGVLGGRHREEIKCSVGEHKN